VFAAKERKERREMKTEIKELCDRVRQTAYDIHVYHGHGHLEKVGQGGGGNPGERLAERVFGDARVFGAEPVVYAPVLR
jgi:hypothetical protein